MVCSAGCSGAVGPVLALFFVALFYEAIFLYILPSLMFFFQSF